ncbi:MAG: phytoene desaturase [Lewinellaceae bacterium]|nr:phytoene desaturase [Lewinellaceae bacterium]HRW75402.1 phytoene desaturase family protein [Saprospiraceae bacterium]
MNRKVDTTPPGRAVVIGAGIAGLGAAIRLAVKGYDTHVVEARKEPGGKLHSFDLEGFRFDAGPSLFTMPEQVTELFDLAGRDPAAYFPYRQLNDACRYFWPDGHRFIARTDPEQFAREAAATFHVPESEIREHLIHARDLLQSAGKVFLHKPLNRWQTWTDPAVVTTLLTLKAADLLYPLDRLNRLRLKEPHLVQLFNRFATYNGSDPYRTPGLMTMIAALEHGQGVFFPEGGMVAITRALHQLGLDLGVTYHFNTTVDEILVQQQKVRGIRIGTETMPADLVLSDMDIWYTYRRLLPDHPAPERILRQERSTSALVFYWGIQHTFEELGLHNIFFSADYQQEFDLLFRGEEVTDDPTIYVHISCKEESGDAPSGGENWFVMVNAPRHEGQDWTAIIQEVRNNVLKRLTRELGQPIEPLIVREKIWSPPGIEADTLSYQGALYGNSSNNRFSAFLRHPNENPTIQGLYHIGGTVHPGGGIPLSLLSAKISTERI